MLTRGNLKLGGRRIWGFGLPSARPTCAPDCRTHCYAVALERYRRNLARSRRRDFTTRVRAFLVAHAVRIVRVHVTGDFYSRAYARKWLHTMRRSPRVRFFFYTRSWRVAAIRAVTGFSATVFQCNLFALPPSVEAFLALPKEVFDSAEGAIRSLEMVP